MMLRRSDLLSLTARSTKGAARALAFLAAMALMASPAVAQDQQAAVSKGWYRWRGPAQNGTSTEKNLPTNVDPKGDGLLWSIKLQGRGTPVTDGERMYVMGYRGETTDLYEVLVCFDPNTGKIHWEKKYRDFLSDIIYNRYSIGAPALDPKTGNVYIHTSPGLLICLNKDGKELWQRSLMEEFGRLTFPNGRTGCPSIDGDLVIVNAITSNWGRQGPARNRFYAFNKDTGQLIWASTPGTAPKDSSFSSPYYEWRDGKRVFYAGTGCGHVVAVNALTGQAMWRFPMSFGGVNSSCLVYKDRLIAIHGKENRDASTSGRMVGIKLGATPSAKGPAVLGKDHELWRNDLGMFTSSPVLVGNRVYQVTAKGELCSVDVDSGKVLWKEKLSNSQLHSSPVYGDGKLYVALWSGDLAVVVPSDKGPKVVVKVKLEGQGIGSPMIWRGRLYVHTTKRLYCFGPKTPGALPMLPMLPKAPAKQAAPAASKPTGLRVVPAETLLQPGESVALSLQWVDSAGRVVKMVKASEAKGAKWEKWIPATAKVKVKMDADVEAGELKAKDSAKTSAGAFRVTWTQDKAEGKGKPMHGTFRGRVLARLPIKQDFESFVPKVPHKLEKDVKFAFPPLAWIGARLKWEIRELDGNKVLAKTLDRVLFQRSMTFFGSSKLSHYTIAADVMSDGNRRFQSSVGVINQRYIILLDGNWQKLQVYSNHDRFKVSTDFRWKPGRWYRIKTRVDNQKDGSVIIRAKAWSKSKEEPKDWMLEAKHEQGHKVGAPGLYGFSPQSRFRVYVDNVEVVKSKG